MGLAIAPVISTLSIPSAGVIVMPLTPAFMWVFGNPDLLGPGWTISQAPSKKGYRHTGTIYPEDGEARVRDRVELYMYQLRNSITGHSRGREDTEWIPRAFWGGTLTIL